MRGYRLVGSMAALVEGGLAAAPGGPGSKKRRRAEEPYYVARSERVAVRRPYPSHVDICCRKNTVRYDPEADLYDLRDALKAGYGNDRAVNVTAQKMGKDFGLEDSQFERLKWSDGGNTGFGRIAAKAAVCATVLRDSIPHHKRQPPLSVTQAQIWFEEQAGARTQPSILDATVSAHGLANQRS